MKRQHFPGPTNKPRPRGGCGSPSVAHAKFAGERRMVPEVGIEPTRPCGHGILSPARLPVSPLRHSEGLSV